MLEACLRLYLRVYDFNYPDYKDLIRLMFWTF